MAKYRRRPSVVEAVQFHDGMDHPGITRSHAGVSMVFTMQNVLVPIRSGEWIIKESAPGRYYPCDPTVFAETYDLIEGDVL